MSERQMSQIGTDFNEQWCSTANSQADERHRVSELEAELASFSYIVSHDLLTTLRHVKGFVGLLERELPAGLSERQRNFIDRINQAADTGQAQVEGLAGYSRVQQQPLRPILTPADPVLAAAWSNLGEEARRRGAELSPDPLGEVVMDPKLVTQAFERVLDNAIRFTPEHVRPLVVVKRIADPDDWVLHVSDNGVGVEQPQREKVFEMFHRLNPRDPNAGAGVGLTIARRIFRRLGGDVRLIDCASGTCVEMRLPQRASSKARG